MIATGGPGCADQYAAQSEGGDSNENEDLVHSSLLRLPRRHDRRSGLYPSNVAAWGLGIVSVERELLRF